MSVTEALPFDIEDRLEAVAARVLGISLKVRNNDSLDFHDLSVTTIKDALAAAFESGYDLGAHHGAHNVAKPF